MLGILHVCLRIEPGGFERDRCQVPQRAMRALRVVVVPERTESYTGFG